MKFTFQMGQQKSQANLNECQQNCNLSEGKQTFHY